jgi:hypothetical protein
MIGVVITYGDALFGLSPGLGDGLTHLRSYHVGYLIGVRVQDNAQLPDNVQTML